MKKTFLFLSLAVSLVLPAVTHSDSPDAFNHQGGKVTVRQVAPVKRAPSDNKVVYYITDTPRTGSAIPMVYRRYGGRLDSASAAAVYGQSDINRTGAIDVSAELVKLDPSFTSRGRH